MSGHQKNHKSKKNYKGNRNNNYRQSRNNDNRDHRNSRRGYDNNRQNAPKSTGQEAPTDTSPKQVQSKAESSSDLLYFIIFLVVLAGYFLARKFYFPPEEPQGFYSSTSTSTFMKEGKLTFLNAQSEEIITDIDIEVAKTNYETNRGLMNRRHLPANGGMLFIFNEAAPRTFWMKDTYLSLDIIFVDADKEIIRISKNAQPLSEVSIPSGGKAQYVVEVLAGFTDAYNIHVGDHIDFQYE